MAAAWIEKLKTAQKTCLVQDGRRKIHFTFPDGTELAEEYDVATNDLVVRRWRMKGTLGGSKNWETEIGETMVPRTMDMEGMVESNSNVELPIIPIEKVAKYSVGTVERQVVDITVQPVSTRKDSRMKFQWRIRNLPYPIATYSASLDEHATQIVIRTTNKKYYKKFPIPDMERIGQKLMANQIQLAHANNTLIISYQKPKEILEMEKLLQDEFKKIKATTDGDVDCRPS